jgi:hypothetical protein
VDHCQVGAFGKYYVNADSGATPNTSPNAGNDCDAGYKCYPYSGGSQVAISSATHVQCGETEICESGTYIPVLCPPGTISPGGYPTSYNCQSCPADKVCPEYDMTAATAIDCPAGYVCLGGAIHQSNRDEVTIRFCSPGKYCDISLGAAYREKDCEPGTYNKMEGQS